jgi:hypothetical protein
VHTQTVQPLSCRCAQFALAAHERALLELRESAGGDADGRGRGISGSDGSDRAAVGGAARRAEAAADFGPDGFGVAPAEDDAKAAHIAQARFRLGVRGPPPLARSEPRRKPDRSVCGPSLSSATFGTRRYPHGTTWYPLGTKWVVRGTKWVPSGYQVSTEQAAALKSATRFTSQCAVSAHSVPCYACLPGPLEGAERARLGCRGQLRQCVVGRTTAARDEEARPAVRAALRGGRSLQALQHRRLRRAHTRRGPLAVGCAGMSSRRSGSAPKAARARRSSGNGCAPCALRRVLRPVSEWGRCSW